MLRFFVALYCRTDDMWYAEDRLVSSYSYFLAVVFLLIDHDYDATRARNESKVCTHSGASWTTAAALL